VSLRVDEEPVVARAVLAVAGQTGELVELASPIEIKLEAAEVRDLDALPPTNEASAAPRSSSALGCPPASIAARRRACALRVTASLCTEADAMRIIGSP
jgi:hypothetical protein